MANLSRFLRYYFLLPSFVLIYNYDQRNDTQSPTGRRLEKALAEEFGAEYMRELKKKTGGRNESRYCYLSVGQANFQCL